MEGASHGTSDRSSDGAELWRLTMQHSPVGMALVALDGRFLLVNRALADMLGYEREHLVGLGFQEVTHPEDLTANVGLFSQTLRGEIESYRVRKRYLHATGRIVWGDLSVAVVRARDGRPLHVVAQILDVSEQEEYQQRLQEANEAIEHERQTLEAIFETVNVGLLLIDRDGRYERMNRRHQETMRLPFPDGHRGAAGQLGHVYRLDGRTLMTREEMPSFRAVQGEEFDDFVYWVGDDPITRSAFSTSARQVRGPSGERRGAVLAYQEITDLMRAMEVKDDFVSSVSHELRTPLTAVLGHLEMLCEEEDLPAEVLRQLRVVQRNANRLRTLVSDLLLAAQARDGSLQLHRTNVDLAALVREAVEVALPQATRSDVALQVDAPERVSVLVDGLRIRQVVDNLVSNAVKYTLAGGEVSVVLRERGDDVELAVSDTGIGIAQDEIDQVFNRFFRGGAALEKHIPGTGLGLNIVHSIVASHGGEVTLESELGRGSTFRVTLPRELG